jgi:hypothetical protein
MKVARLRDSGRSLLVGFGLLAMAGLAGCQSDINGQTSPSANWQKDGVQYFPSGSEANLSKEAAAMNAYRKNAGMQPLDQQASQRTACSSTGCSCGAH